MTANIGSHSANSHSANSHSATSLGAREIALSTSGIDTLADTFEQDLALQAALAQSYPAPDDRAAWAERRNSGALAGGGEIRPPAGVRVRDDVIDGVACRIVEPDDGTATGEYLHLHGGGWCLGSHLLTTGALAELVAATGLRAISVGYRLAPEHSLHDAIADARTVARSVTADRRHTFHAIGGESAGAHLSVTTLLGLRDEGSTPFSAAVLTYGVYDMAGTAGRRAGRRSAEIDNLASIVLGTTDPLVLRDPALSPLYADLTGLPTARFLCGTRDGLLEDTLMMEARWRTVAATELDLVAGADHAFTLMPGATTTGARSREAAFLRTALADHQQRLG